MFSLVIGRYVKVWRLEAEHKACKILEVEV